MINIPTINRSLLLIKPKQAFYDWSSGLTPDLKQVHPAVITDYNSYLLEDELFLDNPKKELAKYWKAIFLNELFGQWTNDADYPPISWKLFTQWFTFEKSSMVMDLTDAPLHSEN